MHTHKKDEYRRKEKNREEKEKNGRRVEAWTEAIKTCEEDVRHTK